MDLLQLFAGLLVDGAGVRAALVIEEGAVAAGIEIAARLGLEAAGLTLPLAFPAGAPLPEGRVPVWIGLGPGPASVTLADAGVWVTGPTAGALLTIARYLAANHPEAGFPAGATALRLPEDGRREVLVGEVWTALSGGSGDPVGVGTAPQDVVSAAANPVEVGEAPQDGVSAAQVVPAEVEGAPAPPTDLTKLFSAHGGLVFPLPAGLAAAEGCGLIDLAARVGVEATHLEFPLTAVGSEPLPPGLPVRVNQAAVLTPEGDSRIRLTTEGLTIEGAAALAFLAQTPDLGALRFCQPPAEQLPAETIAEWRWSDAGEVARFWQLWRSEVRPQLAPGAPVAVDLRLQAPLAVRSALREELQGELPPGSQVWVRTPFKQGYHWIEEEVLPNLRRLPGLASVELQCRGFAPQQEPALELPIRWLQEAYPFDLLLERELGLPLEAVGLTLVEEGPTYRLIARDGSGALLHVESLEATTGCRLYLDRFPERGWVHPPESSLSVGPLGSTPTRSWPITTDLACFWDWYQATVLTGLHNMITLEQGEEPPLGAQPLFGCLEIEMTASAEERVLGLREENISPLEALHEDLYFVTLDEFATWGRQLHGAPFDAPGMILPRPLAVPGVAPAATVKLSRLTKAVTADLGPIRAIELSDGEIRWGEAEPTNRWALTGPEAGLLTPAEQRLAQTPPQPIPLDELIGPTNLEGYLAHLAQLPGVQVWQVGQSWAGRPLWAVAWRSPSAHPIRPPQKSSALRPVFLINGRHHANEVSSTNAILRTIEAVALGPDPGVDLVAIPYENADGAATHWELAADNPTWKHHAARFNAVGLEFYNEYTRPDTPYTEARALAELFDRWQPDILLDDHGVPAREWIQPFAGWNSAPYFRVSYWLPNALLYGIFRQFDAAQFPAHVAATDALIERLARRAGEDPIVSLWNERWLQTYKRWGHDWDPECFPLELHEGMINYRWPVRPHAFSARFPETCVLDWVTEVPDETATGEHLARTAWAHQLAHQATIELLAATPQPVQREGSPVGNRIRRRVGRARPFRI